MATAVTVTTACEAGVSIKPGAQAPGSDHKKQPGARETGDSVSLQAVAAGFMLRGLELIFISFSWGLCPRLYAVARFAGSIPIFISRSWGLRPRLYAVVRFADLNLFLSRFPGACAPGFMLSSASRTRTYFCLVSWGLGPRLSMLAFASSWAASTFHGRWHHKGDRFSMQRMRP
jgi:hypothetical protein